MKNIPDSYQKLISDRLKTFAFLATVMPDCSPQVTPVWFNTDDEHILINTMQGRVKDKNMRARPQVSLAIMNPADPYHYLQIRGKVVEYTTEGAEEHINTLSLKYTGEPWTVESPHPRVIFKILPESFDLH